MVKISALAATALAMSAAPSSAFTPVPTSKAATTELHMTNNGAAKAIGSSMVAASIMLSTVITPDAAIAAADFDADFGPTSSLIAGKSGGRAGGRSSSSTMRSSPPSTSSSRSSTTTINRTTVIQAPAATAPVIVAPPPVVVGSPLGYSPFAP